MLTAFFIFIAIIFITFIISFLFFLITNNADITFAAGVITFVFLNFYFTTVKDVKVIKEKYIIQSTANNQVFTNGSFTLGSGIIYSKEYYLANIKKGNKIERIYIPVDETVRIIDLKLKNKAIYYKLICKIEYPLYTETQHCYDYNKTKDILYIPKNAITKIIKFQ